MRSRNAIVSTSVTMFAISMCGASLAATNLPELLPETREIEIAQSAGPSAIAKSATIYVLRRGGYEVARKGRNGFACLVTRHDDGSFEPQCFDPEGVATLLPVALERARLLESGMKVAEVEATIAEGYEVGRFRPPGRAGVTYMLSTENLVFNGEKIISYPPHVMIMAPFVTNADIGADLSNRYLPWVLNEGTPYAYIMVITQNENQSED